MRYKPQFPESIHTQILLPSSKSISNRALIIYALTHSGIRPLNLAKCDDTDVMLNALSSQDKTIDIGAAGTAMRFLTAYLSVTPGSRILTGTTRMKNRPIHVLVDALRELGANITYLEKEGYPPLLIEGQQLSNNKVSLDGSVSSQFISALLLIAPTLKNGLQLTLKNKITSKPYINMTLEIMKYYGANVCWSDAQTLSVATQGYAPKSFTVEPDWSAASYWFSLAALTTNPDITLKYLTIPSLQGDHKGADLFKQLGVSYTIHSDGIQLHSTGTHTSRFEADFSDIPDLVQTFVVTACLLNIPFHITGVATLRVKETDRIAALITELDKLGYVLYAKGDQAIYWENEKKEPHSAPSISTYQDHRMAMSFAPAAIRYPNLWIENPEVVTKSYPHFWEDLEHCGTQLLKK